MSTYGPDDRALFESDATELYEEVVAQGGIRENDPRIAEPAFELLVRLGLLSLDGESSSYLPIDPSTVQAQVVSPLGQEGAKLLDESSHWARAFGSIAQTWRRAPHTDSGPFTHVNGPEAIQSHIAALVADCEEEMLTAQPQTGRDAATMAAAAARDTALLERGMTMRTLYQHSARRSSVTHKYVAAVSKVGGEVRTLDEFFNRMIVFDRRIAVIPGASGMAHSGLALAISIREPSIVDYLSDIFERTWERARPFTNRETSMMRDIAVEQRAMTIRMLIEGHADPLSAKRLGVSPRTYAGYVADLKGEYESETRFQLGYTMGRQGVSGNERHPAGKPTRPKPKK